MPRLGTSSVGGGFEEVREHLDEAQRAPAYIDRQCQQQVDEGATVATTGRRTLERPNDVGRGARQTNNQGRCTRRTTRGPRHQAGAIPLKRVTSAPALGPTARANTRVERILRVNADATDGAANEGEEIPMMMRERLDKISDAMYNRERG